MKEKGSLEDLKVDESITPKLFFNNKGSKGNE
jgi:hypothetical protein